ncbi:hypothetical protein [Nocardia sp. NPDC058705]|uniref:hypothetical protein n=1 Tax=Nocardia sp. NPDC058705 TaxID=3346609 RepID=UPI0036866F69
MTTTTVTKPKATAITKVTMKPKPAPVTAAKARKVSEGWAASVREVVTTLSNGDQGAELATACTRWESLPACPSALVPSPAGS